MFFSVSLSEISEIFLGVGCRGGEKAAAGGGGGGGRPIPIHWRGALLEGSTRSQPRQRPFSGRRARLRQKRSGTGTERTRRYCTGLRLAWRYPARESGWRGIHTDTMRASVRACFRAAMAFSSFQTFTGSITMRADERGLARAERREDSDPDSTRSDPPRPRPRISLSKSPASSRSSFQLS